jgi:hypothetical protein
MKKRKPSGRRRVKDLVSRATVDVKGGDEKKTTTTNTGKAAGNVSAGWDVKQNVHI